MATSKKTTNGHNGNGEHVSLSRAEYMAFIAREESYQQLLSDAERTKAINRDLTNTCELQGKHLSARDLRVTYLERIAALQQLFLDALRGDQPKVGKIEDLFDFWRLWQVQTSKAVDEKKLTNADVDKHEPDLFKAWRSWTNGAGKDGQAFDDIRNDKSLSGREMQEHIIVRQRQDNAKLANRILQLESELEETKAPGIKSQEK